MFFIFDPDKMEIERISAADSDAALFLGFTAGHILLFP